MTRFCFSLLVVCCALAGAMAVMYPSGSSGGGSYQQPANTSYHQLDQLAIGGDGGWDYLICDSDAQRLYIARETRVQVVDLSKGKVVGEVANTPGVHGIALDQKLHRGFTSNGGENTVTLFNTKNLQELQRIAVGTRPDAIVFDPASRRVFTMNGGSNDITAIDAAKERVVGTISLGGRPEYAAVGDHGRLFVNITDTNEIVAIDTNTLTVLHRWSLAPGEHPTGLAIDAQHRRLFSVCGNAKMIVLDADNGRLVETLPIGYGPDAATFDPDTGFAFSSNGRDGTLTVIHEDAPDTLNVTDTVTTQLGARTMAVDNKTHRLYLATASITPAPAGADDHHPTIAPNSFVILVYGTPAPQHQHQHQGGNGGGWGGGMGGHHHGGGY